MNSSAIGNRVTHLNISEAQFVPLEPYGKVATVFRSANDLRVAGVWTVDAGQRFQYELPYDLFVFVVEGQLHVALQDTTTVAMTKGDVAYFVSGQATEWNAREASRAVFCCISDEKKIEF